MYHLEITPFGNFERFHLYHTKTGNGFALVPEFGACVLELRFGGRAILDGYTTPEEMIINKWGKNVVLYPFPNRLRQGQYKWQGKTYQFPVNDAGTGNALHGFGMNKPMRVEEIELEADMAEVTCLYVSEGDQPGYPFRFSFAITFRMEEPNRFEVELLFQNDDELPIPAGFGWHPYFKLTDSVDQMHLQMPPVEKIEIDDTMIPTGKRLPFNQFANLETIGQTVLDNCFALNPEKGKAQLQLIGNQSVLHYWQETGEGKFNFLQLFTSPLRKSLAVEPMTCNINAFNNKEGLLTLAPGESAYARFGFSLETLS